MVVLRDIIDEKGWQQKQAAEHLGLTQHRVSDLKNGKIEKFSIALLIKCLYKIGFRFKSTDEQDELEAIEDEELNKIADSRKNQKRIEVDVDEL